MEEQECEVVYVSNKSPKKENILEDLAKYKLKQQEQQQHVFEAKAGPSKGNVIVNDSQTLSIKGELSLYQTSKGGKGKNISLEKQSAVKSLPNRKSQFTAISKNQCGKSERQRKRLAITEYLQNSAKCENKPYLKNDFEVGITEYISQGEGISADVNHYDDDFQVHEISLDGSVVHLTKMLNLLLKPNHCEKNYVIASDLSNSIDAILLKTDDEEIKTIEIDITEMDKIGRNNLQKILNENVHLHVHKPVSVAGGRLILNICRIQDERRQNGSCDYVQFVLYTEKMRTAAAIDIIAKKLRKSSACFMTAENKIARSISQLVTMTREDCIGLSLTESLKNISIGNFSFAPKPLQRGDLKGNHFTIALRKIIGDKGHIEANLRSLKDNGFINYCESQHFLYKSEKLPKHLIGKQLLLKQWQEVIDLILLPPELKSTDCDRLKNVTLACIEYKLSRVVRQTFKVHDIEYSIKAKLLSIIKTHGENLIEAVNAIPLELRLSFVRAYQRFLWNTIVSKRIAKFGTQLIVGDLVYASVEIEGDSGRCDNNRQHKQREVIIIDQKNIHKHTIYDVVLPLPGCNITYPANEVTDWYKDLLLADGLLEKDFNLSLNTYGINGAYRPVVLRPSDLKWKFVHYENADQSLIPTDLDRLQQVGSPSVSSQGAYLGLVLEFSLPAFAWGTMALREILKVDIIAGLRNSTRARKKLKNRLNVLRPRQELPSPLATTEVLDELQMKKIREKPCNADQPLSETSKSFLDLNQNRLESAARQLSKEKTLREIKPESGNVEKQTSMDSESFEVQEPLRTKRIAEKPVTSKQLVDQRKNPDQESTSESRESKLKGTPATIENPPPATREPFKKPLLKEEQATSKQLALIATDFTEEIQKNQIFLQPRTCQMSQPIEIECLKKPQTNVKVEPGICQMHSSTFTESFEEPKEKKIKLDPDTDQEEVLIIQSSKGTKFKSIMYVDLISDQED